MLDYEARLEAAGDLNTDPHPSGEGPQCGAWWGGEKMLCGECYHWYSVVYPQGWAYYPGDTCEHGVYVGGCGRDFMCIACELDFDPYDEGSDA